MTRDGVEEQFSGRRLTTVVAADICGYSRLAANNEAAALKTVSIIAAAFERVVERRRGRIFHRAGDGFLAEFQSASEGVLAALEFVEDIRARDTLSPANPGAFVRAGVHVGDVVEQEDGDLLGHGVNIAFRLQENAEISGVLISSHTVGLVDGKIGAQFRKVGAVNLRNIDEPIEAYEASLAKAHKRPRLGLSRQLRQLPPGVFASFLVLLLVLAANLFVLSRTAKQNAAFQVALQTEEQIEALNAKIETLTKSVLDQNSPQPDPTYEDAVRNSVSAILAANNALYAPAIEHISNGEIMHAVRALKDVLATQRENGAASGDLVLTLRALAALAYYEDPKLALSAYKELYEDYKQNDAQTLNLLGDLYLSVKNDPYQARAMYLALKRLNNRSPQADVQAELGLGKSFWYLKEFTASEQHLKEALRLAQVHQLEIQEARALASLGSLNIFTKDYREAEKYRLGALAIERILRNEAAIGRSLNMLAAIATHTDRFEEAIERLTEAMALRQKLGDKRGVASVHINFGRAYYGKGDYQSSAENYIAALEISETLDIPNTIALSFEGLSLIAAVSEDEECVCQHVNSALSILGGDHDTLEDETRELLERVSCTPAQTTDLREQCIARSINLRHASK